MVAQASHRDDSFWMGTRCVRKAGLVSQHLSSGFVDQHYEILHTLGKGAFGHVNLVCERATGQKRVCKTVTTTGMPPHVIDMMRKEIQLLSALDHPHIVKLYEFAEDQATQEFVLVLEYVAGGNCLELLKRMNFIIREKLVARLVDQLFVALDYCHASGIVHRDVKPENMMLNEVCGDYAVCKLIDFGLATPYKRPIIELAGTAPYLAPEVAIQQGGYSPKADVWSAGVTAFELLAGVPPFGRPQDFGDNIAPILERIRKYKGFDELVRVFAAAPASKRGRTLLARDFLRWILQANPEDRVGANEAMEHSWLERHRIESTSLTIEMVRSLAGYVRAPPLARSCLFAIAAKGIDDPAELEEFGAAFLEMDGDGDGKITREELAEAVDDATNCCGPRFDVDDLFSVADLDSNELLSYTEFIAGCLYSHHGPMGVHLAQRAFEALDHDRDGLVHAEDIAPVFRKLPKGLSQHRPFSVDEWCECVVGNDMAPCTDQFGFLGSIFKMCTLRKNKDGDDNESDVEILTEHPPSHKSAVPLSKPSSKPSSRVDASTRKRGDVST